MSEQLHGPLAETPDGDIHDYGDHPDRPDNRVAATTLRDLIRQAWPMRNDYFGVRMMLRSLIVRARRLERGEG